MFCVLCLLSLFSNGPGPALRLLYHSGKQWNARGDSPRSDDSHWYSIRGIPIENWELIQWLQELFGVGGGRELIIMCSQQLRLRQTWIRVKRIPLTWFIQAANSTLFSRLYVSGCNYRKWSCAVILLSLQHISSPQTIAHDPRRAFWSKCNISY